MADVSVLGPIDPKNVTEDTEKEKAAPWVIRKLVGVSDFHVLKRSSEHMPDGGSKGVFYSESCKNSWLALATTYNVQCKPAYGRCCASSR